MNIWNNHHLEFPNNQECIYKGPGCTGLAEQGDHNLHKCRKGDKGKRGGLENHLNSIINFGPACKICNVHTKFCDTQKGKERGMEWAVNEHGIQKIAEWAGEFPESVKREGSEWWEMVRKLTPYSSVTLD